MRRPVYARALRFAARYAAKNTASSTFANSPGWMENPAIRIQMRAPFTAGNRIGSVEQDQRRDHADVRVALEHPVIAQQQDDQDEQRHAQRRPHQLGGCRPVARGLQVEPVDQHQPQPVQQHPDGQEQGVGVRGPQAYGQVGQERQHAEAGAVAGGAGRKRSVPGEAHGAVAVHRQQDGQHDEGEFDAPAPGEA